MVHCSMTFDLEQARRDTPACERHVHLNNAGAALMPSPVVDALRAHLDLEIELGGYEAALLAADAQAAARVVGRRARRRDCR